LICKAGHRQRSLQEIQGDFCPLSLTSRLTTEKCMESILCKFNTIQENSLLIIASLHKSERDTQYFTGFLGFGAV
jgi:hypothetical protein